MDLMTEQTAVIATSIVGPILTYLKIRDERRATSEKRDTDFALIFKRLNDCEDKLDEVGELKDSINKINNSLTRIETILELYIQSCKKQATN